MHTDKTHEAALTRLISPKPFRKGMSEASMAVELEQRRTTKKLTAFVGKRKLLKGVRG
jgi:hypothetical protein